MKCTAQTSERSDNAAAQVPLRAWRHKKSANQAEQYTGNLIAFRLRDGSLPPVTSNMLAAALTPSIPGAPTSVVPISRGKSVLLPNTGLTSAEQAKSSVTNRHAGELSQRSTGSFLDTATSALTHRNTISLAVLAALTGGLFAGSALTEGLMSDTSQSADSASAMVATDSSRSQDAQTQSSSLAESLSIPAAGSGSVAPANPESDSLVASSADSLVDDAAIKTEPHTRKPHNIDEALRTGREQADGFLKALEALRAENDTLRTQADALRDESTSLTSELLDLEVQLSSLVAASQPLTEIKTVYNFVNLPTGDPGSQSEYTASPAWANEPDPDYVDYTSLQNEEQYYVDSDQFFDDGDQIRDFNEDAYVYDEEEFFNDLPFDEGDFAVPVDDEMYGIISDEQAYEQLYYDQ